MQLTQEQVLTMILDAFRAGRTEGYRVGIKEFYCRPVALKGYRRGWHDAYCEIGIDLDSSGQEDYMEGYTRGREDRRAGV